MRGAEKTGALSIRHDSDRNMWVEYLFLLENKCLRDFKSLGRDNARHGDKEEGGGAGGGGWREKRIKVRYTSATWWRVRFPVIESTEASSRSMYISRSPQSWSLPDSLSRLRIILIRITARSPCNKPHNVFKKKRKKKKACSAALRKESGKCALLTRASHDSPHPFP